MSTAASASATVGSGASPGAAGRGSVAVAFVTLLIVGTDLFVVSPLLPDLARQYGISPGTAGNSVTVFSVAYMVAAPFVGSLADRLGRRTVLVGGLACFGLANVLTAVAPTFALLLAARLLAGAAASGITPSVLALVGQSAPPARRGTWMSTAMAGFLISLTTGAPTGTAAAAILGWRAAFVGIGVVAVALVAVNVAAWRGVETAVAPRTGDHEDLRLVTKLRAVSVTGLWALSVYAFYTYLGTALSETAHLSAGPIAVALVVYGVGAVLGSLGGGRLADRFGAGRIATLSLVALAATQALVGVLLHAPAGLLLAALGLFALTAYPCLPAYQSRLVTTFGRHSGSVLAWNSSFMYLGTSVGAAVGGWVLSRWGFAPLTLFGAVVALAGAVVYTTVVAERPAATG